MSRRKCSLYALSFIWQKQRNSNRSSRVILSVRHLNQPEETILRLLTKKTLRKWRY